MLVPSQISISAPVEQVTKSSWLDDQFSAAALKAGTLSLLLNLLLATKPGRVAVPSAVEEAASRLPTDAAERLPSPEGVGEAAANFVTALAEQSKESWSDQYESDFRILLELRPPKKTV